MNLSIFNGAIFVIAWIAVLVLTWFSNRYWGGGNSDTEGARETEE